MRRYRTDGRVRYREEFTLDAWRNVFTTALERAVPQMRHPRKSRAFGATEFPHPMEACQIGKSTGLCAVFLSGILQKYEIQTNK